MKIAIVTGASSGLGRQFVLRLDQKEELDEIWVIARREERLLALQKDCRTTLRPIPKDLTQKSAVRDIQALLDDLDPEVHWLFNCAGFGKIGPSREMNLADTEDMIDLNCRAAAALCELVIPHMKKPAHIVNICSIAAFQPLPYLNTYAATKSFLLKYSRALGFELLGRGIRVTAVCPYWVKDTEFIRIAQRTGNASYIRHFPFAAQEKYVASRAFRDAALGLPVSCPSLLSWQQRLLGGLLPDSLTMAAWNLLRRL